MATIRDLITGSLRLIGVVQANETPTQADIENSLDALNALLESWSTEKLSIYTFQPYEFSILKEKSEYTLGPTGDWVIPRPMQVMEMYVKYNTLPKTSPTPPSPNQYYTSNIYPFLTQESIRPLQPTPLRGIAFNTIQDTMAVKNPTIVGGQMNNLVFQYTIPKETLRPINPTIVSGSMRDVVIFYNKWPKEPINISNPTIVSGSMRDVVIFYSNWPKETINITNPTIVSGSMRDVVLFTTIPKDTVQVSNPTVVGGSMVDVVKFTTIPKDTINIYSPTIGNGTLV